eukprot:SAG31_NODE_1210_length_9377_cov_21.101207_3_plen_1379_part_00
MLADASVPFTMQGCLGLSGFYARWMLHVFGLPMLGLFGCWMLHCKRIRRGGTAQKGDATGSLRSNLFTLLFVLYPTVCHWTFSAFSCRRISRQRAVLTADYAVQCYDYSAGEYPQDYFLCACLSAIVAMVVAFGIPIGTGLLLRRKMQTLRHTTTPTPVATHIATELGLRTVMESSELMHEVEMGHDYGFVLNAFRPSCYQWELFDMLRKMILVGAMVVCSPGSVFQIWLAALLSLSFLAAHFHTWPYKLRADNVLKATVEVLIFVTILVALVLANPKVEDQDAFPKWAYDVVLVMCYAVTPVAFGIAVLYKTRQTRRLLREGQQRSLETSELRRLAYELHRCGLLQDEDRHVLFELFGEARARGQVQDLKELADRIEGRHIASDPSASALDKQEATSVSEFCWHSDSSVASNAAMAHYLEDNSQLRSDSIPYPVTNAQNWQEADGDSNPFEKYSGGFEGTFADTNTYFGGLVKLVGEPQKNVPEAVRKEHCHVKHGYGMSRQVLTAGNYGVTFTPEKEYKFVSDPHFTEQMSCGIEKGTNKVPILGGWRRPLNVLKLSDPKKAVQRIRQHFLKMGWSETAVTEDLYASLNVTTIELIALRLYTGPMFVLYNGVLRAMATDGIVRHGHGAGLSVKGCFVSTLHSINSGVIKLSRLQPIGKIYRGMSGMKLPRSFIHPDAFGVRSGVEYAFMSTTMDRTIAEIYSRGSDPSAPSLVFEMEMGMVNRGAFLGWISQYPDEVEILLPPLTGLEVLDHFETSTDGTLVFRMQLNVNLRSLTIEEVLALRHKQCVELAELVSRDLALHANLGDIPSRQTAIKKQLSAIKGETDPAVFNDNVRFVNSIEMLLANLPRGGDHLQNMQPVLRQPVFALAVGRRRIPSYTLGTGKDEPLLVGAGWDGTVTEFACSSNTQSQSRATMLTRSLNLGSPALSLALLQGSQRGLDGTRVAVGMQNGTVALASLGGSHSSAKVIHTIEKTSPVTVLAWLQDKSWLACGSIDEVSVYVLDPNSDTQLQAMEYWRNECGVGRGLCWVYMGGWPWLMASSLDHGQVKCWRIESTTGTSMPMLLQGHVGGVNAIVELDIAEHSRAHQHQFVASGSTDGQIIVWNLPHGRQVARANNSFQELAVCSLASVGNAKLASGSADATVKLWQVPAAVLNGGYDGSLQLLSKLSGHTGPVHALAFFKWEGWLASGASDGSVCLWRGENRWLHEHEQTSKTASANEITEVLASSNGYKVAVANDDGNIETNMALRKIGHKPSDMKSPTESSHARKCVACGNHATSSSITCLSCGELLEPANPDEVPQASRSSHSSHAKAIADALANVGVGQCQKDTLLLGVYGAIGGNGTICTECGANSEGTQVTCPVCGELMPSAQQASRLS